MTEPIALGRPRVFAVLQVDPPNPQATSSGSLDGIS
jgi:hypothetical protein